jgi:hypothetical protein
MAIWDTIISPIVSIINKIVPDKAAAAAAIATLNQMQLEGKLQDELIQLQAVTTAQTDINKVEAAQPGLHFRDGAGWVCVAGFAITVLKAPIEWVAALAGHPITLPTVDTTTIVPMLFALLGLGGMHVYEKTQSAK